MSDMNLAIQEILERMVRVETKIDGYNHLKDKADEAYNISINNQAAIAELKDNLKWLWRTVVGAIIVSTIGLIIKGGVHIG